MNPFEIRAVKASALDLPMRKAFGIAGGAQAHVRNVLVEVELASSARGYGEAAPLPAFNGETQADASEALARAMPHLAGVDVRRFRSLAEQVRESSRPSASAACALETATLDALTRELGTSLRVFFGGSATELTTDVTITTGTIDDARREATAYAMFGTLKIKVGGGADHDVDLDVERVLAVRSARPDARLLLDANGGLEPSAAVYLARTLSRRDVGVALFEQPTRDLEGVAEVRAGVGVPIALDESITSPADVIRAHRVGAADAVNVKIMKSGLAGALDIAAATRACGLVTMIGGMVETRLAMGASAALAAGLGGFTFIDLDTPMFLAEDPFAGGYVQNGERLDLADVTHGHGCVPHRRFSSNQGSGGS